MEASNGPSMNDEPHSPAAARWDKTRAVRWWRRRPWLGVAASLLIGLTALWTALGLAPPARDPASALFYFVTLPIALLLPASAFAGALLGWDALRASSGPPRRMLLPVFGAALLANSLAIAAFVRTVAALFTG